MTDMTVGNTIRNQLGRAFEVVTGARNFISTDNGLSFGIMGNMFGVTHVIIALNDKDLYDMAFLNINGMRVKEIAMVNNVYFDDLHRQFRDHTGLETRMPKVSFK
jgi:hypothetical protein